MSKFEESNFYKALQDFFINADKKTFLQFLAEFYNRTEGIIDKNVIQDELIKELRELYLEFNEKGIDENIVREKVNYFLENSLKIKDVISKLNRNTNNIKNITLQMDSKANKGDLITLENRIDNFTKLPEGSTTGDAELIDGRVGASGIIYENMGDNIRDIAKGNGICNNVITPIKTTFIDVETSNLIYGTTYEKGKAIRPSDGTLYDVSSYQTTDYISCVEGQELVFSHNTNLCFFNEKTFVRGYQGGQWNSPLTVPNGVNKFRFCYPIKD